MNQLKRNTARRRNAAMQQSLWEEQNWHFFVMIGFDQLIHQATLASTVWIMVTR
jgi:hypothetical protein